ncbi:MAG TPA: AraC family transcriptional regulator [Bacteroidia bacterium]|nr:AraC family transcriptional regulator [Bacteroidia bacterium]
MPKKVLPIYSIENFNYLGKETDFYANTLKEQLKSNRQILMPHKHDFFFALLITQGSGTHTIDFVNYEVKPGRVFMISPGQVHDFSLSKDVDGYLFFHTKSFYDSYSPSKKVQDYPFFCSIYNSPLIVPRNSHLQKIKDLFIEIQNEFEHDYLMKYRRIHVLAEQLYIDLTRIYLPQKQMDNRNQTYLSKVRKLEDLIDSRYKKIKSPSEYAKLLFISEKHLNRICKECLNKTTSDLIIDRIMLEAKRMLTYTNDTVAEIAEQLGYMDNSYFARLFKKRCGKSPAEFAKFANKGK